MLKALSVFKVNLVNYRLLFASVALLTFSAAACTREKPPSPLPTQTLVALEPSALATPTLSAISSPGVITPLAFATASATETPGGPPLPPTSQPPATIVTIPTTIPIATIASPPTQARSAVNPGTYTVQLGDWLNKIASQFGVSTQAILAANPGVNANFIYPGQVLKIPSANAPAPAITPGASGPTPVAGLP
ncbi:MAG: LysM peptidoglycan-binding domain-containing protein, partial [Chloroflexi bacterium]|nr:LysM peptidoglycan-binding domain-containing protein [Chloroflexota bacterium]